MEFIERQPLRVTYRTISAMTITEKYRPGWGPIPSLEFDAGDGRVSKGALADVRRGKGRRGGLRRIYYHFSFDHQIWFMTLYDKDEASDLTAKEKKAH